MKKICSLFFPLALGLIINIQPAYPADAGKKMNILVYPFKYQGGKEHSWIAAGLTDTVITDLHNITGISVFSDDDRRRAVREMELGMAGLTDDSTTVKIGNVMGADIIFTGSIQVAGNSIRVNARLVNVETSGTEKALKVDGTLDSIFDMQDMLVNDLMNETGKISIKNVRRVDYKESDKQKINEKYKPKREAYENYAKGIEVMDIKPALALEFFKRAIEIDPEYTDAYVQAGYTAGSLLNLFTEGLDYLKKAEAILVRNNRTLTSQYADVLHYTGEIYHYEGNTDRALEYYLSSLGIRDRLGLQETDGYADTLNTIGIVYRSRGDADKALEYYSRAEKIRISLGLQNTDDYASLMNNMGLAYSTKGEPDRALEYYMISKNIRERLNLQNSEGYAALLNNIGSIYTSKDQPETALDYLIRSRQTYEKIGLNKTVGFAVLLSNIAGVYEMLGRKDLAGQYYRMAYDTYTSIGYKGKWRDSALKNAERLGK